MTKAKYARQRGGVSFYAEVELDSITTSNLESFVTDYCTWNMIKSATPKYTIGSRYNKWKEAAISGIKFALTRISHKNKIEVKFIDLNGHPAHSNLHSIFAAGFLCTFKHFEIEIKQDDLENLYDFVASSIGIENINESPNENNLIISQYNK